MITLSEYLKDKILIIILNIFGMILLSGFLLATSYPQSNIILILIVWVFILTTFFGFDYFKRRNYFKKLTFVLDSLDKRYLIGEVMDVTYRLEDRIYRDIIKKSNKSVIEKIYQLEKEQLDYREYIESWIHEVKAPLTAINLICENNKDESTAKILSELRKLENYLDLALFYARSETLYQDYLIRQTDLEKSIVQIIQNDKQFFIEHQFSVDININDQDKIIYTDEKWFQFILKQILLNSVKYRAKCCKENPVTNRNPNQESRNEIRIFSQAKKGAVTLTIEDNGIGIPESELPRIFEKGFTGSNGRRGSTQESTGIGLYLCKKLCDKMDIGIKAESTENEFTRIILTFPLSKFYSVI